MDPILFNVFASKEEEEAVNKAISWMLNVIILMHDKREERHARNSTRLGAVTV